MQVNNFSYQGFHAYQVLMEPVVQPKTPRITKSDHFIRLSPKATGALFDCSAPGRNRGKLFAAKIIISLDNAYVFDRFTLAHIRPSL